MLSKSSLGDRNGEGLLRIKCHQTTLKWKRKFGSMTEMKSIGILWDKVHGWNFQWDF